MIVTPEDIRRAIVEKVEELKLSFDYPIIVEYDNHQSVNHVDLKIVYVDGMQMGLSMIQPGHRVFGSIVVEVMSKAGTGMREANAILYHFYSQMQMTNGMYPVRTYAARLASRPEINGWTGMAAIIPFWADSFPCCIPSPC
jgi:hypothetical protein